MTAAKTLRLPDYLAHILQAITRIEAYTAGVDQQAFFASPILQDAVIRNVEIIGEAANNILKLDGEFGKRHPEMPLKAAYAMRNSLSHGYFLVDPVLVWGTVKSDLPGLQTQIVDALKNYHPP
jgi:uncharacterized protein with HEPN domain